MDSLTKMEALKHYFGYKNVSKLDGDQEIFIENDLENLPHYFIVLEQSEMYAMVWDKLPRLLDKIEQSTFMGHCLELRTRKQRDTLKMLMSMGELAWPFVKDLVADKDALAGDLLYVQKPQFFFNAKHVTEYLYKNIKYYFLNIDMPPQNEYVAPSRVDEGYEAPF